MIQVYLEAPELREIEKRLGWARKDAPRVLKKAVNEVSRQMLKDVRNDVKAKYRIKPSLVNKETRLEGKSTVESPQITIVGKGQQHELMEFSVSPNTYNPKRKKAIKGAQLKADPLKELEGSKGYKAFIIKFRNGHVTAAQRQTKPSAKSKLRKRYVKKLMGSSMMIMMNQVWKENEEDYSKRLREAVDKHIEQVLGGR